MDGLARWRAPDSGSVRFGESSPTARLIRPSANDRSRTYQPDYYDIRLLSFHLDQETAATTPFFAGQARQYQHQKARCHQDRRKLGIRKGISIGFWLSRHST